MLVVLPGLLLVAASADFRGRQPLGLLPEPHQRCGVDVLLVPDLIADVDHVFENDDCLGNVLLIEKPVQYLLRAYRPAVVVAEQPAISSAISSADKATYVAANEPYIAADAAADATAN